MDNPKTELVIFTNTHGYFLASNSLVAFIKQLQSLVIDGWLSAISVFSKKNLILFFFLLFCSLLQSQSAFTIQGGVGAEPYQKAYMADAFSKRVIDSTIVTNGNFKFSYTDKTPVSFYNISFGPNTGYFIQLVLNMEDISFYTSYVNLTDSIVIYQSDENKVMYNYVVPERIIKAKIEALKDQRKLYQPEDEQYKNLLVGIAMMREERDRLIQETIHANPKSYYGELLSARLAVKVPPDLSGLEKNLFLKEHFLDNIDFSYEPFKNGNLLDEAILKYIGFYDRTDSSRVKQILEYTKAVDFILGKATVNQNLQQSVIKTLLNIFRFGDYDVLDGYIYETYELGDKCSNGIVPGDIEARIANISRVAVGHKAPDITLPVAGADSIRLSAITTPYTLLVFWATTCPHCTEMLPELKKLYLEQKQGSITVLAISLDKDRKAYTGFIENGNYNWLNYCDYMNWEGPLVKAYNVAGTPGFFLLDSNKTIIAKPISIKELSQKLKP